VTLAEAIELLGLDPSASEDAIKRAYLRLLKKYHPERDKAGFLRLREAFELVTRQARSPEAALPEPERLQPAKQEPAPDDGGFQESWGEAWSARRRGELQPAARAVRRLLGEAEALRLEVPPRQLLELLLDLHAEGFSEDAGQLFRAVAHWMEQAGRKPERGSELQWRVCGELTRIDPLRTPHAMRRLMVESVRADDPSQTQWALCKLALADPAAARAVLADLARGAPTLHALFWDQLAPESGRDFCWKLAQQRISEGSFRLAAMMVGALLQEEKVNPLILPFEPARILDLLLALNSEGWGAEARELLDTFRKWLGRTGRWPFDDEPLRRRWTWAHDLAQLEPAEFPREVRSMIARAVDDPRNADQELRAFASSHPREAHRAWQMLALHAPALFEEYAGPLQTGWAEEEEEAPAPAEAPAPPAEAPASAEAPPQASTDAEKPSPPLFVQSSTSGGPRSAVERFLRWVSDGRRWMPDQVVLGALAGAVLLWAAWAIAHSGHGPTAQQGVDALCIDVCSASSVRDCRLATQVARALESNDCEGARFLLDQLEAQADGPSGRRSANGLELLRAARSAACPSETRGEPR
jgi:hypothetical protein